jgi:polar amino acid transport system substrate-binding protein
MSYAGDGGSVIGFDIEILCLMAKELDVHLEITGMDFSAVMAAVQAGKADIGTGSIIATDERRESVDFVEYYPAAFVLIIRETAKEGGEDVGFWESVGESFEKTFIREDRWILFLQGIGTTMLITVCSIIFGTLLGFFVFMLCRKGNPVANIITRFCIWLVLGMPVVVLLMILYYIIFSGVSISGTAVSIVGFSLTFGAAVFGMVKIGVNAVDRGQTEAAYALGYSDRRAFFHIVIPQALPFIMPAYKRSITELIKSTAIVGYVAVQDLTKIGDIIRSRTYEAFFPLIAVAVIYFILAAILTFIVNRIEIGIDPRKRKNKKLLKGVNLK